MQTDDRTTTSDIVTFDDMAAAYLEDYALQGYRTLNSAKGRVANLRTVFGGRPATAITPAVRVHLPPSFQDILDFAYYSGWRRREVTELTWNEVDLAGGVVRLSPTRSKTKVGRLLPISTALSEVLARRAKQRGKADTLVFKRDGVTVRAWKVAWRNACRRADVPGRLFHDCRLTRPAI